MPEDKDFLEALRMMGPDGEGGAWTNEQKLLWAYLSSINDYLYIIAKKSGNESEHDELMGQFKIQPQGGEGSRKGPPPVII